MASYLCSKKLELSVACVKDFNNPSVNLGAFVIDYSHLLTDKVDTKLLRLRGWFEDLSGGST